MFDSKNIKLFYWIVGELKLNAVVALVELDVFAFEEEMLLVVFFAFTMPAEEFTEDVLFFTVEFEVVLLTDELLAFVELVVFTGVPGTLIFVLTC
jgi:hypothetical protein